MKNSSDSLPACISESVIGLASADAIGMAPRNHGTSIRLYCFGARRKRNRQIKTFWFLTTETIGVAKQQDLKK